MGGTVTRLRNKEHGLGPRTKVGRVVERSEARRRRNYVHMNFRTSRPGRPVQVVGERGNFHGCGSIFVHTSGNSADGAELARPSVRAVTRALFIVSVVQ